MGILNKLLRIRFDLVFIGTLLFVAHLFQYEDILKERPRSIHQWRQTDCLSLTQNYYQGDRGFLQPAIHNQISDDMSSGKSAGEFPGLYYAVASLWKVFGKSEFLYRLLNVLISFVGLFCLFRSLKILLKDNFWAIGFTLLLFCSPIFAFYSNNFLTNTTALSFVFAGWFVFLLYHKKSLNKFLWLSFGLFAVAALLKVTAAISIIALGGIFLFELLGIKTGRTKAVFPNLKTAWMPFLMAFILIAAWYGYADYYNDLHGGKYTFNSIWPIWELSKEGLKEAFDSINEVLIFQVFSKTVLIPSLFALLATLMLFKKVKRFYYLITLFVLIGSASYIILWFQAMNGHDYYLINLLLLPVLVWTTFMLFLKEHYSAIFSSWRIKTLFFLLLGYNVYYCSQNMELRYFPEKDKNYFLSAQNGVRDYFKWMNWDYKKHMQAYETVTPYLDSLGIEKDDKVISLPDPSINISLYLMNRKGWTGYTARDGENLRKSIEKGAEYLIINDESFLEKPHIKPYVTNKIGEYKNLLIYRL